ncbi:ABC transporter substrate-binding protein [Piscinibacter sp.]|uniref:ABC transporter substrate-binding protein n=1 Tax=Piscinibacter sp. TaxID=1903157 RepID=UPI002F41DD66
MKRRGLVVATPLAAGLAAIGAGPASAQPPPGATKVFRYAFNAAETGFDPARINDLYSRIVTAHIFEAPYKFDYLARPFKVQPNTAAALPEVSDDFRTWTIRIRPGIFFADDPAFGGKRRELVAQDYVYAWKRFFDPVNNSPVYSGYLEQGVLGVEALRQEALKRKMPFDYDREIEGIRAVDRYTLQFRLDRPRPRFLHTLADSSLFSGVAREVVEFYGEHTAEHPVGTGPFKLTSWRRSSLIVLDRYPGYREVVYDAEPNADDAAGQALLQRFKGRRLPMIDRVEIAIIEEQQPRWLSFLNREFDLVWPVPLDFANEAVPKGRLAPHLAKRGMQMERIVAPDRTLFYFNMDDPLVGGMEPQKVALRRAIGLATDVQREIVLIRRHQAVPAQSVVAPGTYGYDPHYKSVNSDHDVARAKALLDMYGYVDRDGDGWREGPDGRPFTIECASYPDATGRQFDEAWKVNMDSVGIRLRIRSAQFPEQLKAARAGQLMVWQLAYSAASPDVQDGLQLLYGPASGGQNLARFRHARFDQLYEGMQAMPDGPARLTLLDEALKIVTAYMPHKYNVHRVLADLFHPWVIGYRRPLYGYQFWQSIDIDDSLRPPAKGQR